MAIEPRRRSVTGIRELTPQEGKELLDRAARRYLQISSDEFLERWESGDYDDDPDRPEVMRVAMLIPFGR